MRWLSHLGTVELSLELSDRTLEVEVNPLEAAIIELFSEKGPITGPIPSIPLIIFSYRNMDYD